MHNGRSEVEAAPGSATKIITSVLGTVVLGDLDGDGDKDAALVLVHAPGGSGTFYYTAAALKTNGTYRGTNAVLLGDRIAPQNVTVRNGVIAANYADLRFEEPMFTPPSVDQSRYLTLEKDKVVGIQPLGEAEQVVEGRITIGYEVRSFLPCSQKSDLWLLGNSPAMRKIVAAYHQTLPNPKPYTPLFMVLAGSYTERPTDGFGHDTRAGSWRRSSCRYGHKRKL